MYEELGSVKEPVELSSSETLASAEELLRRQGYRIIHRTGVMVVGKRENPSSLGRREPLHLAVFAQPHLEGGLRITLQGDDREGVRERQGEWSRWAEDLPKVRSGEKKEYEREPERTSSIEMTELQSKLPETEAATIVKTRRTLASGERNEEGRTSKAPGNEGRWQEDGEGEGKAESKRLARESGAWTSVAPWERKVRIAPGKFGDDLSKLTEDPT